ncbi:hypothetical protein NP493_535g00003 [Ridgeia piscesae]|uniref:Uncharacterized protein n=1 Tax=Ridgeia piscesae TaxID=27915 RepID=A0AAD9KXF4_RIDPI|nr:hypothetical protein NP493_535g00003 [Ridgeia piscesae]
MTGRLNKLLRNIHDSVVANIGNYSRTPMLPPCCPDPNRDDVCCYVTGDVFNDNGQRYPSGDDNSRKMELFCAG